MRTVEPLTEAEREEMALIRKELGELERDAGEYVYRMLSPRECELSRRLKHFMNREAAAVVASRPSKFRIRRNVLGSTERPL